MDGAFRAVVAGNERFEKTFGNLMNFSTVVPYSKLAVDAKITCGEAINSAKQTLTRPAKA
jgi:hypothetical protein